MKQTMKILLVEDDELASELITDYLHSEGFDVTAVNTATDGVAYLKQIHYDLLILDLSLPDFDGFELLKNIKNSISLPVIITSAHSDTKTKVLAFKYGATDYMVKPLDLEELVARIWVHLSKNSAIEIQNEKELFYVENQECFFQGEPLELTKVEYNILSILIAHRNQVVRREDLIEALSSLSSQRSLDNHIKNIRKKIGDENQATHYLKTEYGVGYKLVF